MYCFYYNNNNLILRVFNLMLSFNDKLWICDLFWVFGYDVIDF